MANGWSVRGRRRDPRLNSRLNGFGSGLALAVCGLACVGVWSAPRQYTVPGAMLDKKGKVEYAPADQAPVLVEPVRTLEFRDRLETLENTWAWVRLVDGTDFRLRELTAIEIVPRTSTDDAAAVRQTSGRVYYSNWQRPLRFLVQTAHALFYARGTEFVVSVFEDRTEVAMFDGEVLVTNEMGSVTVPAGFEGVAAPGQRLVVRPMLEARNLIQWWLYYPGVLDPAELEFDEEEKAQLAGSLAAYAVGDLNEALVSHPVYPAHTVDGSGAEVSRR